jgi:2-C-methyl-D-erythritol 4-phosphate cytidylyltransferase
MYSLRVFMNCAEISHIVVVAPREWHTRISSWPGACGADKSLRFAPPGGTRQHSVYSGLCALQNILSESALVVVHDAARPLVTARDIKDCLRAAKGRDGATPVLPPRETIYKSADGRTIAALLNRDELFAGQTPEAYRFGKYLAAHGRFDLSGIRGGSELAFKAGMKIRLYPGNPLNFKVTNIEDLEYLRFLLERGEREELRG